MVVGVGVLLCCYCWLDHQLSVEGRGRAVVCFLCCRGGSGGGFLCTGEPYHGLVAAGYGCWECSRCGCDREGLIMTH